MSWLLAERFVRLNKVLCLHDLGPAARHRFPNFTFRAVEVMRWFTTRLTDEIFPRLKWYLLYKRDLILENIVSARYYLLKRWIEGCSLRLHSNPHIFPGVTSIVYLPCVYGDEWAIAPLDRPASGSSWRNLEGYQIYKWKLFYHYFPFRPFCSRVFQQALTTIAALQFIPAKHFGAT